MEKKTGLIYRPTESKTMELVDIYAQTHPLSHRYLAYRDVPGFINQFVNGKHALDYGAGTGISSSFLYDLGFNVIGTDISSSMLGKAKSSFPYIQFYEIDKLAINTCFNLIFSSFVLFDMRSKDDIINYFHKANCFMKEDGIFIGITGSEHLYDSSRNWTAFDANFEENQKLCSGDIARLRLKHPEMEFYDYFWKEIDYLECFEKAGLKVLKIHRPLGSHKDPYSWEDELFFHPFTVFIAQKFKKQCD